jgi:hypothetical protein
LNFEIQSDERMISLQGGTMQQNGSRIVFAVHVAFALLVVGLITLNLVAAEAIALHGEPLLLNMTATSSGS